MASPISLKPAIVDWMPKRVFKLANDPHWLRSSFSVDDVNVTPTYRTPFDIIFGRTSFEKMVGARGFEPPTPWSRTRCATRLRYAPNNG